MNKSSQNAISLHWHDSKTQQKTVWQVILGFVEIN